MLAFMYASHTSIEYEAEYPYTQKTGTCHNIGGVVNVVSYKQLPYDDPVVLANAVNEGPVSVGMQGDSELFKNYKGGVIKSKECGTRLNHAALIIGWGKEVSTHYWIVKNSFGTSWGEDGYFRVERSLTKRGDGICGIMMDSSYPTFE